MVRRYAFIPATRGPKNSPCLRGKSIYHNAVNYLDRDARLDIFVPEVSDVLPEDPHWPSKCADCDYEFRKGDQWETYGDQIYEGVGATMTLGDAPPGAIWRRQELEGGTILGGPDGLVYTVRLPGHQDWTIDRPSSTCSQPTHKNHRCWVRSGQAPLFTVENSDICAQGGQDLKFKTWTGSLIEGVLTTN